MTRVAFTIAVGLWLVATAIAAGPPVIARTTRHFDHARHAQSAGAKEPACTGCHDLDANGAVKKGREHQRCASCHKDQLQVKSCDLMKQTGAKGPARLCQVCHQSTTTRCLPSDLPARPTTDSYAASFTHAKHVSLGSGIEKHCGFCHADQAPANQPKQSAHSLCAGCHNPNGSKPSMGECVRCHTPPTVKPAPAADPYRLPNFDHRLHHDRSKQASCLGCHEKLTGEPAIPRPAMLGCQAKCHDGKTAFSTTGTQCTACHQGNQAPTPVTPIAFSHATHSTRGVAMAECATCHSTDAQGALTAPLFGKQHQPCATSGCHQAEFASKTPRICGACHDAIAPWQSLTSRSLPAATSEYVETFDHSSHLGLLPSTSTGNAACETCHGSKLTGAAEPKPHAACAGCHSAGQAEGKPNVPAMTACASCHSTTASARATATQWSVAPTFQHTKHATAPRSSTPTPCVQCHSQVTTATTTAVIANPSMQQCGSCHDGTTAFKTTGFGCARCHQP